MKTNAFKNCGTCLQTVRVVHSGPIGWRCPACGSVNRSLSVSEPYEIHAGGREGELHSSHRDPETAVGVLKGAQLLNPGRNLALYYRSPDGRLKALRREVV